MGIRLRIREHPLHPLLVHFPVALWSTSVLGDLLGFWLADPFWWEMSFWCLALGLIIALPALVTGFFEYTTLEPNHPAMATAMAHMLIMITASSCFLLSLVVRGTPETLESSLAFPALAFSGVGFLLLLSGGWLGGTLTYRYGIGRSDNA